MSFLIIQHYKDT